MNNLNAKPLDSGFGGAQKGRRVVKTHAPADGFPIWEGVTVVAVYRHPLDVFFSLRKHVDNKSVIDDSSIYKWPVSRSITAKMPKPNALQWPM